jgi:LmbE family N-acetylglucosaminyl deacetylase
VIEHGIPERALVVAAHADDLDFRCAGTLAKWCRRGCAVTHLILTDSAKGSHDLSLSDAGVAEMRLDEQRAAARQVGYTDLRVFGEVDGLLSGTEPVIESVVGVIREVRPDVVLSYDPWAPYILHPDHTAAGDVAFRAVIRAREPRFYREGSGVLPPWKTAALWLFAPLEADHVEDITEVFEDKLAAILSHRSQYPTEMGFTEDDEAGRAAFIDRMHKMFATIGGRGGCSYGEEYRRLAL